jgi:hypothetical protein
LDYKVTTTYPIKFEKVEDISDSRFTQVKIYLCHTKENLNRSYFDKKVLENMIPSLANTPILGYITADNVNENDFNGHQTELVITSGEVSIRYLGRAYGLIPQNNDAHFENKVCEDGVEREFLVCNGILWNKFPECVDILERDGAKGQSMELDGSSIVGHFEKDNLFHFDSCSLEGACLLGDSVQAAMIGSVVEKYSYSSIKEQLCELIAEYNQFQSVQGGDQVLTDDNQVVDPAQDPVVDPVATFSLTNEQLRQELRIALGVEQMKDDWGYEYRRYWYLDSDDANIYAYDGGDHDRLVSFAYAVNGDAVTIDFATRQRCKIQYVPLEDGATVDVNVMPTEMMDYQVQNKVKEVEAKFTEEKQSLTAQINEAKTAYTTLEQEAQTLREYAQQKQTEELNQQKEQLFAKYASAQFTDDEIAEIRATSENMSVEELENSFVILAGKKALAGKFSVVKEPKALRIPVNDQQQVEDKPYGGKFEKYRQ